MPKIPKYISQRPVQSGAVSSASPQLRTPDTSEAHRLADNVTRTALTGVRVAEKKRNEAEYYAEKKANIERRRESMMLENELMAAESSFKDSMAEGGERHGLTQDDFNKSFEKWGKGLHKRLKSSLNYLGEEDFELLYRRNMLTITPKIKAINEKYYIGARREELGGFVSELSSKNIPLGEKREVLEKLKGVYSDLVSKEYWSSAFSDIEKNQAKVETDSFYKINEVEPKEALELLRARDKDDNYINFPNVKGEARKKLRDQAKKSVAIAAEQKQLEYERANDDFQRQFMFDVLGGDVSRGDLLRRLNDAELSVDDTKAMIGFLDGKLPKDKLPSVFERNQKYYAMNQRIKTAVLGSFKKTYTKTENEELKKIAKIKSIRAEMAEGFAAGVYSRSDVEGWNKLLYDESAKRDEIDAFIRQNPGMEFEYNVNWAPDYDPDFKEKDYDNLRWYMYNEAVLMGTRFNVEDSYKRAKELIDREGADENFGELLYGDQKAKVRTYKMLYGNQPLTLEDDDEFRD